MNRAYLLLGGNTGNRSAYLGKAQQELSKVCGAIQRASAIYETAAWGRENQPAFLNQVLYLHTPLTAIELLHAVLNIELQLGRVREEKYAPRTIDIDLLLFNKEIINLPKLTIPHPEMQRRRFVLQPLAEIAPRLVHPVLHKTIKQLLAVCTDPLPVTRYAP